MLDIGLFPKDSKLEAETRIIVLLQWLKAIWNRFEDTVASKTLSISFTSVRSTEPILTFDAEYHSNPEYRSRSPSTLSPLIKKERKR
ncbi:hypothetical protein AAMO2058_000461600 [Amorphochlora amoebiformis]